MLNVQEPQAPKHSPEDAAAGINKRKLPARIVWIMTATALATFGFLVAAYNLLF